MPWDELGKTILTALESVFTQQNLAIGHVKFSLKTSAGFLMGNLTGSGAGGELRGSAGQMFSGGSLARPVGFPAGHPETLAAPDSAARSDTESDTAIDQG